MRRRCPWWSRPCGRAATRTATSRRSWERTSSACSVPFADPFLGGAHTVADAALERVGGALDEEAPGRRRQNVMAVQREPPLFDVDPPIHQKNALLAAASAWSCIWENCDRFWQLEHVTWGFRSCMIANPPPPNGSTRFCAGKASTPTMMRRMSWNATFPGSIVPPGSTIVVCRSDRKNDCSYETYSAVRLPVTSQCPPKVGSKA